MAPSLLRLLAASAALLASPASAFSPSSTARSPFVRTAAKKAPSSSSFASNAPLRMSDGGDGSSSSDAPASNTYGKVFVAGGSKGVGRLVIDALLSTGAASEVVALVRSDEAAASLSAVNGVTAIKGDAFVYKDVEGALDGCDAAVTTLGGATDEGGQRVDYVGNNNVIEAAGILGVTRVVLVTSVGCGTSKEAAPPSVFEALKDTLAAKEKAERVLQRYYTNSNWTIIRPGGLKSEKATGTAILTEDPMAIGSIHREDVANLVVKALTSQNTEKKVLSAVDPEITSAANTEGASWEAFALA